MVKIGWMRNREHSSNAGEKIRIPGLYISCFTKDHFFSLFHSHIRTFCQGVTYRTTFMFTANHQDL